MAEEKEARFLYYATTNQGKILSLQRRLNANLVKVVPVPMDIPEPRSDDVKEIASAKVAWAFERVKSPVVAMDAGFFIPSLNGFPRAYVNFALETVGLEGILKLAQGKDRRCFFAECVAYRDIPYGNPKLFNAFIWGVLSEEPRGRIQEFHWSLLSAIFIPDGRRKTLAEMSYEEYCAWSAGLENGSASRMFAEWFMEKLKNSH